MILPVVGDSSGIRHVEVAAIILSVGSSQMILNIISTFFGISLFLFRLSQYKSNGTNDRKSNCFVFIMLNSFPKICVLLKIHHHNRSFVFATFQENRIILNLYLPKSLHAERKPVQWIKKNPKRSKKKYAFTHRIYLTYILIRF